MSGLDKAATAPGLDASRLLLQGRCLIQASAGTGKTHTILSLVLRALLGQQGGKSARVLSLPNILIVTFTRAATGELRQRMQDRLQEAVNAFEQTEEPEDTFLQSLRAGSENKAADLQRLKAAQQQLDEMSVFTIHSFCYRILTTWAFESGLDGKSRQVSEHPYLLQATQDFWRQNLYRASPLMAGHILDFCDRFCGGRGGEGVSKQTPEALLKTLAPYIDWPDFRLQTQTDLNLAEAEAALNELLGAVQQCWQADKVRQKIEAAGFYKNHKPRKEEHLDAMDAWCAGSNSPYIQVKNKQQLATKFLTTNYSSVVFSKRLKKNGISPLPDIRAFVEAIGSIQTWLEQFHAFFYQHALNSVRSSMRVQKHIDNAVSYTDMVSLTAEALGNKKLARQIREKYPLAFIDEFQDTDPGQWAIFQALYPEPKEHALILIGDPKQAIFDFRGADLHTYLHARDTIPEANRVHADINWRASVEVLSAIEALYKDHEDAFANQAIEFLPVKPKKDAAKQSWRLKGTPLPALTFWKVHQAKNRAKEREYLAGVAGDTLIELLADATLRENGKDRRLRAADVAFLVNDRYEAQAVKQSLKARGLAYVWQESDLVLGSETARDLHSLMSAMLTPGHHRQLRTALASGLLRLPLNEAHFCRDGEQWEKHLARFEHYHSLLSRDGFGSALQKLIADYQIATRQFENNDDEAARVLTDLRQLMEILQAEAQSLTDPFQLHRWLTEQIQAGDKRSDDGQKYKLRLESDEDMIQIVTAFGAKGLEYNLVMLPFGIRVSDSKNVLLHKQDGGKPYRQLVLHPGSEEKRQSDRESLSAALRLLYVALTRAKYACFAGLSLADEKFNDTQALHHLLWPKERERLTGRLDKLLEHPEIGLLTPEVEQAEKTQDIGSKTFAVVSDFKGRIDTDWHLTSYSQLSSHRFPDTEANAAYQDERHTDASQNRDDETAEDSVAFHFPKGAHAGSCLHEILELTPARTKLPTETVQDVLAKYGIKADWPGGMTALLNWLQTIRQCPLGNGTCLAKLSSQQHEIHFYLPIVNADSRRLCDLLGRYGYNDAELATGRLHGMMQGFIDIAFEHQGQFWMADYKSNWLGSQASDYDQPAMIRTVKQHRYDLQLIFYSLAFRRLLRLHGKKSEDFKGAYCLFLRGMDDSGRTGVFQHRPDFELLNELDMLFDGKA